MKDKKDMSEMTDSEISFRKFLKNLNLYKAVIGSPPTNKFKKIEHLKPMLSLSNAFNKKDMEEFLKKINNFLSTKNNEIELFSEPNKSGYPTNYIVSNKSFKNNFYVIAELPFQSGKQEDLKTITIRF